MVANKKRNKKTYFDETAKYLLLLFFV